jgi:hypothetical protein
MNFLASAVAGLVLMAGVTAAYAPETGPADRGEAHEVAYQVEETGRLVDKDGTPKGWMIGNDVYDNAWNLKYRMEGKKLLDVSGQ